MKQYFKGAKSGRQTHRDRRRPGHPRRPPKIVGVVKDTNYQSVREDERPQVFFPYRQSTIVDEVWTLRADDRDPAADHAAGPPRDRRDRPALAIYGVATIDEGSIAASVNERLIATLSTTLRFDGHAALGVGLYGVMAYMVTRRTREIGIRMALGALGSQMAAGVLREAGMLVATGLVAGAVASWALGRFVRSQLYGTTPTDGAAMLFGALVLLAVAGAASLLPARRAARVMPVVALRDE